MRHRFTRPWKIIELPACYCIEDATGTRFAYTYFLDRPRLAHDTNKLDREDALLIVRNVLKLAG